MRRDERPFVLVDRERGALRIAAVDARANAAGIRLGDSLAEARALVPDLITAPANPQADSRFLHARAEACEMFTPLVAVREADGLLLDITGCAHLLGGEAGLLRRARRCMLLSGLSSCAAIAGTPDAAWAFARFRPGTIARPGGEEQIARAMPITALNRDTGTTLALGRSGFRTLGDLADRPPHLLAARFGEDVVMRLRRVLGHEDIRITPLRPLPELMAERHFPEPMATMDSLLAALEWLACDIMRRLEARDEGGNAYEASFFRTDGAVRRIAIEMAQGTRDTASLMRLVRLKIEALADPIDPGFGFDAVRLAVLRSELLPTTQASLAEDQHARDEARSLADLVSRLVARFGRENVQRFMARDTHDPTLQGGTAPYLSAKGPAPWPEPEPGQPPARPLTLFAHPQPIDVLADVPDSPPLRFRWRRVLHDVARAEGPERIAPEWWRESWSAPETRDYYRIEDRNGHRFWIFREGLGEDAQARPRWFLHGLFA